MSDSVTENALGTFLRDRRMRLEPASFGFQPGRRRTPGLRREEVALLANISPTVHVAGAGAGWVAFRPRARSHRKGADADRARA